MSVASRTAQDARRRRAAWALLATAGGVLAAVLAFPAIFTLPRAPGMASAAPAGDAQEAAVVGRALARLGAQGVEIASARASSMPGFVEARVSGEIVHVSRDGRYLIRGEVHDTLAGTNLNERSMARERAQAIAALDAGNMVTYPAAVERTVLTVFTDPDCPYCRAFHRNLAALNAAGITVRYLPLPLDIHPQAKDRTDAAWCAPDPRLALDAALAGGEVPPPATTPCRAPVETAERLARALGIHGTPGVIATSGELVDPRKAADPKALLAELQGGRQG